MGSRTYKALGVGASGVAVKRLVVRALLRSGAAYPGVSSIPPYLGIRRVGLTSACTIDNVKALLQSPARNPIRVPTASSSGYRMATEEDKEMLATWGSAVGRW